MNTSLNLFFSIKHEETKSLRFPLFVHILCACVFVFKTKILKISI
jgi:hypothetical protein